mgnify:CR=1 FL=1
MSPLTLAVELPAPRPDALVLWPNSFGSGNIMAHSTARRAHWPRAPGSQLEPFGPRSTTPGVDDAVAARIRQELPCYVAYRVRVTDALCRGVCCCRELREADVCRFHAFLDALEAGKPLGPRGVPRLPTGLQVSWLPRGAFNKDPEGLTPLAYVAAGQRGDTSASPL